LLLNFYNPYYTDDSSPFSSFNNFLSYILINGNQTTKAAKAHIIAISTAPILPPVLIKPPAPIGIGKGIKAITDPIKFNLVAQYAMEAATIGANIKGINKYGL